MRTCPNCGKDTSAGMTEACTSCGFSPGDPPDQESIGQIIDAGGAYEPATTGTSPPPKPKRQAKSLGVGSLVRVAAVLGFIGFGVISNAAENDRPDVSLDRLNLELAIQSDAENIGVSVIANCPAAVEDSETGDSFSCTARNLSGDTREIVVEDSGSGFTYSTAELLELRRLDRRFLNL